MKILRSIFAALALVVLTAGPAFAQCGTTAPANKFCGNDTGAQGLAQWRSIPPTALSAIAGGTVLGNRTGASAVPTAVTNPVLGIPGTSTGEVGLAGATSGTAILRAQAAAGSAVVLLPTGSGTLVSAASAPLSLNATTGALTLPGAAGQVLAGATPAFTATPVLGVPGATLGTLGLAGSTSGTVTISPQAVAGATNLTLPNIASGTFAVNASSPLVLNAATGGLTCPTCVTSSGGGAITGTAPIAVSGAGAVSITGLAGGVLAGSGPAFTRTPVLGVAGSAVGSLGFQNATSGTVTLQPVTGALGTTTINIPAAAGTLAVSASAPIVLSAAGNLTCCTGNTAVAGTLVVTSNAAGALQVGPNGGTNPVLNVNASVASQATGLSIVGNTTGTNVTLAATDSGTNTSLVLSPKGSGVVQVVGSATSNLTLGVSGSSAGSLTLAGATSGTIAVTVPAVAGSNTLTFPAATDTLVGKATTDTFTNKTYNAQGTGNVFQLDGVTVTGKAAASDYYTGTSTAKLIAPSVIYPAETTTTFGATTTFDFNTFINTAVTLTGNITTMTLSNVKAGQAGMITFIQDGTGSRTSVWSNTFKFAGGGTPTLSTAANAVDILFYSCRSATYCAASLNKAFN
jgi:hypothetical protein